MRTIIGLDVSKASTKLSVAVDGKTTYDGDITIDAIGFQSLKSIIQSYWWCGGRLRGNRRLLASTREISYRQQHSVSHT